MLKNTEITHLYNTGTTNGQDGKIVVQYADWTRDRVFLHYGKWMEELFSRVKMAVDLAIINPNCTVDCSTLEVTEK